ncbi:MAG TPA: SDR family NAD(P)-dependent oxidoreductase [Thermoplasmata archaeon]|nr:SDR family NAD(P)-dependent oxidoreductase [Thermoplasmata archaeon]
MAGATLGRKVRALITGASRGIGAATARRLAGPGVELALHFHEHRAEAENVQSEVVARGASAFLVPGNLEDPDETHGVSEAVRSEWDTLDALVLNAGAYPRAPFEEISEAQFEACVRLNLLSPAQLVRELLPSMRRAASGRIVLVSSVLAVTGSAHGAHYAAAKAGLLGLGRSLARELAPAITVNVVAPGSIDTAILAGDSAGQRAERHRTIPLGRLGTPEEVASSIAFLLGPEAAYITGTTVHVNGGVYLS